MGIHKATYNQTSKKFLHFSSRKINSSMHRQNKKYLSLYLYKGKIGHLYAQKNKKGLHIHAQRNEGCSLHPS